MATRVGRDQRRAACLADRLPDPCGHPPNRRQAAGGLASKPSRRPLRQTRRGCRPGCRSAAHQPAWRETCCTAGSRAGQGGTGPPSASCRALQTHRIPVSPANHLRGDHQPVRHTPRPGRSVPGRNQRRHGCLQYRRPSCQLSGVASVPRGQLAKRQVVCANGQSPAARDPPAASSRAGLGVTGSMPSRRSAVISLPKVRWPSSLNGAVQDGSDAVIAPATTRLFHQLPHLTEALRNHRPRADGQATCRHTPRRRTAPAARAARTRRISRPWPPTRGGLHNGRQRLAGAHFWLPKRSPHVPATDHRRAGRARRLRPRRHLRQSVRAPPAPSATHGFTAGDRHSRAAAGRSGHDELSDPALSTLRCVRRHGTISSVSEQRRWGAWTPN